MNRARRRFRSLLSAVLRRFGFSGLFPITPFGSTPEGNRDTYVRLFEAEKSNVYLELDRLETSLGFSVDREWLNTLALHTQVTVKESAPNWQHGRLLYSVLRGYLEDSDPMFPVQILETGSARGFSALCMSKALGDAGAEGSIVSLDPLPHREPILWNCIDDSEGPKTREELLLPWGRELQRILFVQGWSETDLKRLGLPSINFAFLDGVHTEQAVYREFDFVRDLQKIGDVIVFDDVSPRSFPGVYRLVKRIEFEGDYSVQFLAADESRGYAIARKVH